MALATYKAAIAQPTATPQSQPLAKGTPQVKNNAGGFVYSVDQWSQFERFLILGSEGGTYYVSEKKLTADNAKNTIKCILEDTAKAVDTIVAISDAGRAPKNEAAIFALAIASAMGKTAQDRTYALAALPKVCRIPTHLFHFITYLKEMRGMGRSVRKAIADWYNQFPPEKLAYELVKYQSRDGWSNADLIRLSHPVTTEKVKNAVYRWALGKDLGKQTVTRTFKSTTAGTTYNRSAKVYEAVRKYGAVGKLPEIIEGFEAAKKATTAKQIVKIIDEYGLTREMLPTEALTYPQVWAKLVEDMPYTALIRNLGNLSKNGVLVPLSDTEKLVIKQLTNADGLKKSRVHPLAVLIALKIYAQGHSLKGKGTWQVVQTVVDALNEAFYASFKNVDPTGKRLLMGVDISGSMSATFGDSPLSSAEAAAAMALVVAKTEPNYYIHGFSDRFVDLRITPNMRLDDVLRKTTNVNFGRTDCALPMQHALRSNLNVDGFVVITDNETWHGSQHPSQALKAYRKHSGIHSKQIVIATAATPFTIADPADPGTLDVVGFDSATPQIVSEFLR